jgi:rsbT co-antagonist protein RsbR
VAVSSVAPVEAANPEDATMEGELRGSLDELLGALRAITQGELTQRLAVRFSESHPVGALAVSINAMTEALQEARRESERFLGELTEKIATIEQQQAAIEELSTPIIEVWPGVLCVPILGSLDSHRATELTRSLLETIARNKTPYAIVDVTGIATIDTQAADNLVRMARSVRLLGAKCVLSGVHPNIARTIVQLGVELSGFESHRTLRDALRSYVQKTER